MTSSDGGFGFLLPSQGVKYKMDSCVRGRSRSIDLRLKYEEKRVRDLGIGSDGLTLIHKKNQIFRKFLSRQDVGGFKYLVLTIDLRLKHGMHRDPADLHVSVRNRSIWFFL